MNRSWKFWFLGPLRGMTMGQEAVYWKLWNRAPSAEDGRLHTFMEIEDEAYYLATGRRLHDDTTLYALVWFNATWIVVISLLLWVL